MFPLPADGDDAVSADMDGDRRDVLPSGERFPEHNYSPEGVDSYYHQGSVQPEGSLDTQYYTASQGNGDGRYSPQSSFSTPSEPAQPAAAPQAAAPVRRKPSQRQRSGNLSMLRVGFAIQIAAVICSSGHKSHGDFKRYGKA